MNIEQTDFGVLFADMCGPEGEPESACFDDDNIVSVAGLVPVMTLAEQTGLTRLLADKVTITAPRIKSGSANAAPKLAMLIAGMCAGADSIDLLRSGGCKALFEGVYPPLDGRNTVAGVHLRPRTAVGRGAR